MAIPESQYIRIKAQMLGLSDGAVVSSLMDSSGNNRHATQAASGKWAVFKTGIINGKAVFRFDGIDDYYETPPLDLSNRNQLTVYMVVGNAADNAVNSLAILLGVTSPDDLLYITRQIDDRIMFGDRVGGAYHFKTYAETLSNEFKLLKFTFDRSLTTSGHLTLAINGLETLPESIFELPLTGNFANQPFFFGGLPTLAFTKIDIAEIVIYDRLIVGSEEVAALAYFNSEYFPDAANIYTVIASDLSENSNGVSDATAFSRLTLTTEATDINFGVDTTIYSEDPNIAQLGIKINNTHFGFAVCPSNGSHTINKIFPAGFKTIELTNGSQVRMTEAGAILGTWIKSISANAPFTIFSPKNTEPIIYVLTDSIGVGANAVDSVRNGWSMKLRAMRENKIWVDGWGYRNLKNTDTTATIAKMVAANAHILVMSLATNDFFRPTQTAAAYQAQLAAFLDAAKSSIPALKVILLTMYPCQPDGANSFGSTAEDYRNAMRTVRAARLSWVYIREGTTVLTIDDIETGEFRIHPLTAGHTKIANDLHSFLNAMPSRSAS